MQYFIFITICFALVVHPSYQASVQDIHSNCHPDPDPSKSHYIIGYGSLINAESKNKTYPETGTNIPVRVDGFARTWTARGYSNTSLSTTYLGVEKDPSTYLNGVIFTVPNSEALKKYDDREKYYCRVSVPRNNVSILRGNISDDNTFPTDAQLDNSMFWIYVTMPQFSAYPDEKYPIVQSYVDIFLGGCLQMEKKYGMTNYSDECVTQTKGWKYPWVNDRLHPRRPFTYQTSAHAIDKLLDRHIKGYHENMYIEKIHVVKNSADSASHSDLSMNIIKVISLATLAISRHELELTE